MNKILVGFAYAMALLGALTVGSVAGLVGVVKYQYVKVNSPRNVVLEEITGYVEKDSYYVGEPVPVRIHTTRDATARLYRLGQFLEPTDITFTIPPTIQSNVYHPRDGFRWKPTLTLDTTQLRSGYYYLRLTQGDGAASFHLPIVIKPRHPPEVAVIASTNTWNAYNSYGGKSNYQDLVTPRLLKSVEQWRLLARWLGFHYVSPKPLLATFLPHNRPYSFANELESVTDPREEYHSHLIKAEWALPAFLEAHDIAYGVYADYDLAFTKDWQQAKVIIFNVHSEYWSLEMMEALNNYLQKGGHVIFASGGNMYREVSFYQEGIEVVQTLNTPKTIEYVSSVIGATWTRMGFDTPYAPYQVVFAEHWVFNGTNITHGDTFGTYSANRQRINDTLTGDTGASGWETDKLQTGDFTLLAIGKNKVGPAFMVFKETQAGGWLFNASSITFAGALQHDPVIDQVMKNLINNALQGTAPKPEPHDN